MGRSTGPRSPKVLDVSISEARQGVLACRVVASARLEAFAPALVRDSGRLRLVEPGERADVTMIFGVGHDDIDWGGVAEVVADDAAGRVVVCVRNLDAEVVTTARRLGVNGTLSLEPAARAFDTELADALAPPPPLPTSTNGEQRFPDLSPMESKVVELIVTGATNAEIADKLFLSLNTVKSYIRTAYRKMGVQRRSQAVAWALGER